MPNISDKYLSSEYFERNPTWDIEDAPWKAALVTKLIKEQGITANRICEIGCGAGGVLAELQKTFPDADLFGYDIAPDASKFWKKHHHQKIHFQVGDFFKLNQNHYDIVLLLDVLEHIADPYDFLTRIRSVTDWLIVHFPLDLSVMSVLREKPLLHVRRKSGHIHYFTKGLALELLNESGYSVQQAYFTKAHRTAPQRLLKTRLTSFVRDLMHLFVGDLGARILGGETLITLAKPK